MLQCGGWDERFIVLQLRLGFDNFRPVLDIPLIYFGGVVLL